MDFKEYFISFIDNVIKIDKDNKYINKYKNNEDHLKYTELSKSIYENIKFIDDIENKSFLYFIKISLSHK